MLRTIVYSFILAIFAATGAFAENLGAIKQRKELLSQIGKSAKEPGKMMKQEVDFDEAKVQAALDTIIENAPKISELFPDDSKTGGETKALPGIWENKEDFAKRFEKLIADAKAAKVTVSDEFEFMDTWPKVAGNCSGCHKKYKEKKE